VRLIAWMTARRIGRLLISCGPRSSGGGELQPGNRLPCEAALMKRYHVARMTARQAIQELRSEGRVISEQGRGVFVRDAPPMRRLASERDYLAKVLVAAFRKPANA
jgi:DNA-binding GntR family transcriptional regulator